MEANFHLVTAELTSISHDNINFSGNLNNGHGVMNNAGYTSPSRIERPFSCPYCSMSFKRRYTLQEHIRIHLGARPYACNICGKSFTQRSSLSKHVRVQVCKKKYNY